MRRRERRPDVWRGEKDGSSDEGWIGLSIVALVAKSRFT